jgi:hypothetical protein
MNPPLGQQKAPFGLSQLVALAKNAIGRSGQPLAKLERFHEQTVVQSLKFASPRVEQLWWKPIKKNSLLEFCCFNRCKSMDGDKNKKAGARTLLNPSTFANDCIAAASEVAVVTLALSPATAPQTFAQNLR